VSAPYTPKPDSLAASVVHFFSVNPDEELTLDDISDMQARYHRTGRFGADAAALADVPPMLDFYDQLLKFGSPRTTIDALEVTVRRMKMQQEAA